MKPLQQMNNTEKGNLLAGLFPERLPEITDALQKGYDYLTQNAQALRPEWDNSLFRFDLWYSLATNSANSIEHYGKALTKSPHVFAEQLFAGYNAIYAIDCIAKQAEVLPELPENAAYKRGVQMLFDYYTAAPAKGQADINLNL